MGRTGFLYESVKDQLRWHKLSIKNYVGVISRIGQIMSYGEYDYKKEKVKAMRMQPNDIADALKVAFGDGK